MTSIYTILWQMVEKGDGCWVWKGSRSPRGYGKMTFLKTSFRAHRFVWELVNGQIPEGKIVCHRCDNPSCVRPEHLWLGTTQENVADKVAKGRQAKGEAISAKRMAPRGEAHGRAKLTEQDVLAIRARYTPGRKRGAGTPQSIANDYGVDRTLVHMILKRKVWTHVP